MTNFFSVRKEVKPKNRLMRYAGSKFFAIDIVNKIIKENKPEYLTYYELFLGSGAIYYNLENYENKNFILNDLDENIIKIHSSVKQNDYEKYSETLKFINKNFGNIKTNKKAYYKFRDYYNENNKNGLNLLCLANSCINSLLRFGPNGMNQSFGYRFYTIPENQYSDCHNRLVSSNLLNKNYLDILSNIKENSVVFLDPPYVNREISYNHGFELESFIEKLKTIKTDCLIIYTDIENDLNKELLNFEYKQEFLRNMVSVAPSSHSETTAKEVLYWKKI